MKLSSFPYLIQKEILDHLSINQLFFFSLCSKNTKIFIKETQKNQLKEVERVIYSLNCTLMYIDVKLANESYDSCLMLLYKSKEQRQDLMKNSVVQEVRVNELTPPIDFLRYSTSDSDLDAKYSPDTLESIIESIHSQLCDLLGNHTKFWLQTHVPFSAEGPLYLPQLQNIQKLEVFLGEVLVRGKVLDPTKVDEFLDRSTCLEQFSFSTLGDSIKLRENSKLYDLDTVYVSSFGSPMANDVLKRFNGRHAFLTRNIATSDVIQFLNEWRSGEKFTNLELISVECRRFNLQEIRKSVDIKEVDREVKYSFIRKLEENRQFSHLESGEFKSRSYIVRESDGHVASVMLTDEFIMMGVWNMTEKEFLIKFN